EIMEEYRLEVIRSVPAYAERMRNQTPDYWQSLKQHVEGLFLRPFDEAWVAACEERARFEMAMSQDMRTRATQCRGILTGFNRLAARANRFSGVGTARLIETAMRVLMLDMANAVAVHNEHEVTKTKQRGRELEGAIGHFEASIAGVRQTVTGA